ncbi:Uncharacterised protein [Clostridium carnis]|uniref:Class I SAM-dependent methyltransferase n=1 Tax=Clostridium carnis TaxID=1530 RepID=A0ABY6SP66_9CLOT|nr:class I SAM-dependent methyltransferase [Clostridium carnis]VDG69835.1 Uncharacterised protein [Clostridium carnis]
MAYSLFNHPGPIIEIGSFNGGFTVQLSYICKLTNKDFHGIDIDSNCNRIIRQHFEEQQISMSNTTLFIGTVDTFFEEYKFDIPPALVIIDVMHTYECTWHDLSTVLSQFPNTKLIAMHDYGLRYSQEFVATGIYPSIFTDVKTAVHHICGLNAPLIKIGITGLGKSTSFAASKEEATLFDLCEPEGCAFFPEMLDAEAIHRAISFCIFEKIKRFDSFEKIYLNSL